MADPATIQFLWQYMVHADGQVLEACATLDDEGYFREQGISAGSVHKLLVHCLSAQITWLDRLNRVGNPSAIDPATVARAEVAGRWAATHQSLLAFAAAQTPQSLGATIRSADRRGVPFELPLGLCMLHVSDHATYHRGQLNSMIKLAGGTPSKVMLLGWGRELYPAFAVTRLKANYDRNATGSRFIHSIIENARASGKAGPIAEYLVGAKLSLRFPEKEIRNKRFSTSGAQAGYAGDFEIGNTTFHVTVAPTPELLEKCRENLKRGLRVYLLVPDAQVVGTRQNVELLASGRIAVESIESFVATNIDELSEFDGEKLRSGFRRLLDTYNRRVDAVELDKSMLIDVPPNLD